MELRYNEIDRARNIYERYVQCIPSVKAWVRYAKFEMKNGQVGLARQCYERAVGEMGEDAQTVSLQPDLTVLQLPMWQSMLTVSSLPLEPAAATLDITCSWLASFWFRPIWTVYVLAANALNALNL